MNVMRDFVLMNRLGRDLERLFSSVPRDGATDEQETRSSLVSWIPSIDIREEDKQFVLHADLPGVEAGDIDITLEKGVLTIRGRRETAAHSEANSAGYSRGRIERVSGEFYRRFTLPDAADSQAVRAKCLNGVLEIVIPKQEAVLPRRIDVATH